MLVRVMLAASSLLESRSITLQRESRSITLQLESRAALEACMLIDVKPSVLRYKA
jgi:hypothetical protein